MSAPKRIQLRRTKGWRLPAGAVNVARPTCWGNPFRVGSGVVWSGRTTTPFPVPYPGLVIRGAERVRDRAHAVELFRAHIAYENVTWDLDLIRRSLRGRDLACWCPLEDSQGNRVPCHADVLLDLANGDPAVLP